jgi:uncharacterized protein (TIGR01777 family)
MKIIIPGGSGQVGTALSRALKRDGHEVIVLTRDPALVSESTLLWDGGTLGDWRGSFESADAIINLGGKSVNCRYTAANRRKIMDSRIDSTRVVGEAIATSNDPPKVWLQASTATIYAHTIERPNDDVSGVIGGEEPGFPEAWRFSIDVATSWERAANEIETRKTRKVLMRSAIILSPDRGGIFDVLLGLVRRGLGGTSGKGDQMVSWVHETDFVNAVYLMIANEGLSGPVNIAAPNPVPNREFMKALRDAWGISFGIPSPELLLKLAAVFMRTESELILKSRYVVPKLLTDSGFKFEFPEWKQAAEDLCRRWKEQ